MTYDRSRVSSLIATNCATIARVVRTYFFSDAEEGVVALSWTSLKRCGINTEKTGWVAL